MACTDIFNGFREITESLSMEIYRRASIQSGSGWWVQGIPRGEYPLAKGLTQETVVMNNSEPTNDTPAFQAEGKYSESNTDGHCAMTYAEMNTGFNIRNYSPEKYGLKGILLCRDELTYDHNIDAMVNAYIEELNKHKTRVWVNRIREHYISQAHKYVATAAFPVTAGTTLTATSTSATLPTTQATSVLTKGMLDVVAQDLMYAGATEPDSIGFVDVGPSGPLFSILMHPTMIQRLFRDNPDIRQDYRWAEPKELLKAWGASATFFNFRLVPDLLPPRYDYVGGAYLRRNTFTTEAATGSGTKPIINPLYSAAEYEMAIVIQPKAIMIEFVRPVSKAGQVSFNPSNYMFDFTWAQGAWRLGLTCEDPTEKFGRHFAELRWAIKPVYPEYARVIIYKRCPGAVEVVTCS